MLSLCVHISLDERGDTYMEIRIYRDKKQCTCGIIGMRNICIIKYMNYTYAVDVVDLRGER